MNISIYPKIKITKSTELIDVDQFFTNVQNGFWQDFVIPVWREQDKEQRAILKQRIPCVTMSGIFPERIDSSCKFHTGLLAIDFDDLYTQVEPMRGILSTDPYVYALFTSVSGTGLCAVIRIDAEKHRDSFYGAADYFLKKYQLLADPKCVNESRARYVSYDPHLYLNDKSATFKKYLPKEPKKAKIPTIFVRKEFEDIIEQMIERNVSCVDDYRDWLKVSFALADHLNEDGRDYFHRLSAISNKYDRDKCDKQYDHALNRDRWQGNRVSIATIYYYAKEAGINIQSETTKKITQITSDHKKAGLDINTVISNLMKFEGLMPEQTEEVVKQAFENNIEIKGTSIDSLVMWIKHTYRLRRNVISRRIELNGKPIDDIELNSMWIEARRIFPELPFENLKRVVFSKCTEDYNPFFEWYRDNKDLPYNDEIGRLWAALKTGNPAVVAEFGTRWLVGLVSGIYGATSPLYFILAGSTMGTGKTQFFRRLMPKDWKPYYMESKLDGKETDDLIAMCKNILIMNDEFDGRTKSDERRFKSLTDKDKIDVREPYGHTSVTMYRLCGFGGTSQSSRLLSDPDGNRRIIPAYINSIDWEALNSIDRDALFAQVFRLYHAGFKWQVFGEDMIRLNAATETFLDYSSEYELINDMYMLPEGPSDPAGFFATATEIKVRIETYSNQRTILQKIGQELQRIGFKQEVKKMNGKTARVYWVAERRRDNLLNPRQKFDPEPFNPSNGFTPP